jgi:hypothetical protein
MANRFIFCNFLFSTLWARNGQRNFVCRHCQGASSRGVLSAPVLVFDITGHPNPLNVYKGDMAPYYGHFAAFQHRTFVTHIAW